MTVTLGAVGKVTLQGELENTVGLTKYLLVGGAYGIYEFDGETSAFIRQVVARPYGGLNFPADMLIADDGNLLVADRHSPGGVIKYDITNGDYLGDFADRGSLGLLSKNP